MSYTRKNFFDNVPVEFPYSEVVALAFGLSKRGAHKRLIRKMDRYEARIKKLYGKEAAEEMFK